MKIVAISLVVLIIFLLVEAYGAFKRVKAKEKGGWETVEEDEATIFVSIFFAIIAMIILLPTLVLIWWAS